MHKSRFILTSVLLLVGELISSQVIFNQVFYDTPLNETITQPPYSNGEFIELYNIADTAVSLTGWLVRGSGKTETYSFPTNTIIPANGYLCLAYRHNSTFDFLLDSLIEVPLTNYNVLYQKKIILSNQGEGLSLYDNNGVRIDTMHYSARWAVNEDSLALEDCFSVHRTRLSYNPTNHFTFVREEWDTQFVLLGQNIPQRTWLFPENYYDFPNSAPDGTAYLTSVVPNRSTDSISVSNNDIYIHKGGSALVKTTYINPLGRTSLSLSHKSTPGGRGLATLTDYESNTNKQYLSLPLDESIHLSKQQYEELANDYYQDSYPYFQTTNLPMRETFTNAGETYQTHPSTIEYDVNLENEVMRIETADQVIVNTGYYSQGSLYKTTITDEDGKLNIKYTDDGGLTIIQQIGNNKTYYLYNDLKRLIAILPAPIIEYLATHNQLCYDDALMKNYAYIYDYDAKGNCVYKKQPQQEPVLMQYDSAGRLILSQDGNQRERGDIWTKTTYNDFGQIVSINETDLSSNTITQPLVENFYDDYTFLDTLQDSVKNKLAFVPKEYFSEGYANATTFLTGRKVYTIGDTTYSISAFYYDNNAQTIQQRTIGYDNTPENTFVAYNFSGTISTIYKEQDYIIETYRYEYDHSNRLTRTFYTINGEQEILLSENKYNELGQLTLKQRHNSQLNEQYEYDLRGSQTRQTNDDIDVQYYYADSIPEYATACYNSNVSAIKIKQETTNITSIYSYDSQNRLTDASLLTNDSTCNLENFVYDEVGNILSLQRQLPLTTILIDDLNFAYVGNQITGITDFADSKSKYDITEYQDYADEQIEMFYDQNGNLIKDFDRKICKITYNLLNLCDTVQFLNGNKIEYTYDAMGKILKTKYTIKLESELYPDIDTLSQQSNSIITFTRHYRNNTEYYQTDSLTTRYRVNNQEGYTTFNQTGNQIINYEYNYYHKDRLDNNIAVYNATLDSITQRTFYYPSGVPMSISTSKSEQPYKYNSKQFEQMNGYDAYKYEFRDYYPATARFTTPDPLADRTPHKSPYTYANNNFVNETDVLGLFGNTNVKISTPVFSWAAIDRNGILIGFGDDYGDDKVYLVDDDWDGTYIGLSNYNPIGYECMNQNEYKLGYPIYYKIKFIMPPDKFSSLLPQESETLMFGNKPVLLDNDIIKSQEFWDITSTTFALLHYYTNLNGLKLNKISNLIGYGELVSNVYNYYREGFSVDNTISTISIISSLCCVEGVFFGLYLNMSYFVVKKSSQSIIDFNNYYENYNTWYNLWEFGGF